MLGIAIFFAGTTYAGFVVVSERSFSSFFIAFLALLGAFLGLVFTKHPKDVLVFILNFVGSSGYR